MKEIKRATMQQKIPEKLLDLKVTEPKTWAAGVSPR